jgi:hypothetical protein
MVEIGTLAASGGYVAAVPVEAYLRLPEKNMTSSNMRIADDGQVTVLPVNFIDHDHGINVMFNSAVNGYEGLTGHYSAVDSYVAEYGYDRMPVLMSPPAGNGTGDNGANTMKETHG